MPKPRRINPWAIASATLFILAVLMGAGPGLLLVNPAEDERVFALGMPIIYTWGVFWFFMQILALGLAYLKVWKA